MRSEHGPETGCNLVGAQRSRLQRKFVHCAVEGLKHSLPIPNASKCDGSLCGGDGRLKRHLARGLSVQE